MGTSTRWSGPAGRNWSAHGRVGVALPIQRSTRRPDGAPRHEAPGERAAASDNRRRDARRTADTVEKAAECLARALSEELRHHPPDFMGFRTTARRCGHALVDVLTNLDRWSQGTTGLASPSDPEDRFVRWFIDEVVGDSGLLVDALARRAARRTAERLLEMSPAVRDAVASGDTSDVVLPDAVFCELYQLFFADLVEEFFRAVIFAKLVTVAPVLPLVDPADLVSRATTRVVARVVSPCAERKRNPSKPLTAIARDLADHIVERLLNPAEEAA